MSLKLGVVLGTGTSGYGIDLELIKEAENLGYDSVWTSEAWGSDAVSPAAWVLANTSRIKVGTGIMQMSARTPACTAMTVMTLQMLSGGRFILGLGPSGPQVIEGWHGEIYGRPLTRLREYVEIVRKILERKEPLTHDGYHYQIPQTGEGSTGLGKPLKSILHGDPSLKIISGSISPAGVRTAAEICDGFIPVFLDIGQPDIFEPFIDDGFGKADAAPTRDDFMLMPFCHVHMGDDLEECRRPAREHLALYVGGMGARDKNFYNDYAKLLGFEDAAIEIQDHFLAGRRVDAANAVPDELVDRTALVGPKERIVERLQDWKAAADKGYVHSLLTRSTDVASLRVIAETVL